MTSPSENPRIVSTAFLRRCLTFTAKNVASLPHFAAPPHPFRISFIFPNLRISKPPADEQAQLRRRGGGARCASATRAYLKSHSLIPLLCFDCCRSEFEIVAVLTFVCRCFCQVSTTRKILSVFKKLSENASRRGTKFGPDQATGNQRCSGQRARSQSQLQGG
jgi:hypothetical protein